MAREITWRFEDPDSTEKLNNAYRRMFNPGVYMGYTVEQGTSGGMWIKFTHETDPDNTSGVLGKIYTRDGAVISEDANQDDVVEGPAAHPTLPNWHYVVVSYTYNASRPPNDSAYVIKEGTAGTPPTPPTIGEDEVLIAKIYVPAASASYSATGVEIFNVGKLSLYDDTDTVGDLTGIVKPGIYDGITTKRGSTDLQVTMTAGTWITKENATIVEAADQANLFTITDPAASNYRLCWVIGAHKNEDADPAPSPDYLLVEGSAVAVGTQASLPSDAAIQAAVYAVSAVYDTDGDSLAEDEYINKLGIIRVENRAGTYHVEYHRGETYLLEDTTTVYGAQAGSSDRSGKYFGANGLTSAIADVYALNNARTDLEQAHTIYLDGEVKLSDTPVYLPSNTRLQATGANAKILSESAYAIKAEGYAVEWNGTNDTVVVSAGATSPPGGKVAKKLAIQATYQTGDSLSTRLLSYGDRIFVWSEGNTTLYEGYVVQTDSAWQIEVHIDTQFNTDGDPVDLDILVLKRNIWLENLEIGSINTADGALAFRYIEKSGWDGLRCRVYDQAIARDCQFGSALVSLTATWGSGISTFPSTSPTMQSDANTYGKLRIEASTGTVSLFQDETNVVADMVVFQENSQSILGDNVLINLLKQEAASGSTTLNGTDLRVIFSQTDITNSDTQNNRVHHVGTATNRQANEWAEFPNQDRNLRLNSQATLTWTVSTGALTWDDDLKIDLPYSTGNNIIQVASSPATLSTDGDRLYVRLSRGATGDTNRTPYVRAKASAASDERDPDVVLLALRRDNVIYLMDGTRIEDQQAVTVGATPPPDGSVTYSKLATDAVAFHNKVFRDYVSVENNDGWDSDLVFLNTGIDSVTYTSSTGRLRYASVNDLTDAKAAFDAGVPLSFMWNDGSRHEILRIDSSTTQDVYVQKGLSFSAFQSTRYDGAIAAGPACLKASSTVTYTYSPTTGRVTFGAGQTFRSGHLPLGSVLIDPNDTTKRYKIFAIDTSTSVWVDIPKDLRDFPTSGSWAAGDIMAELDNNPLDLPVEDLRSNGFVEFIPLDFEGADDGEDTSSDGLRRILDVLSTYAPLDTRLTFAAPHDPRIRLLTGTQYRHAVRDVEYYTPQLGAANYSLLRGIVFTGACTNAFLVSGPAQVGTQAYRTYLDGVDLGTDGQLSRPDTSSYFAVTDAVNANAVGIDDAQTPHITPGIHTFVWTPNTYFDVRGILVVNEPSKSAPYDRQLTDGPGKLVRDGGVETIPVTRTGTLPTNPATWDKGGRAVRYLTAGSTTRQWATSWVRSFTSTGDIASGTTIINVTTPEQWRIGDMVMIIDSATRIVKRITNISGSTITVDSTYSVTGTYTLYYLGATHRFAQTMQDGVLREEEEVAYTVPITEFSQVDDIGDSKAVSGKAGVARTGQVSVRLSDASTGLRTSTGWSGPLRSSSNSDYLNITFTGTGISVELNDVTTPTDVELFFMGVQLDDIDISAASFSDVGGVFCLGDLPYGTHTLQIGTKSAGTISLSVSSITVFQPKKPSIPVGGFELLDTNLVAETDYSLGATSFTTSGTDRFLGTIEQGGWCSVTSSGTNVVDEISDSGISDRGAEIQTPAASEYIYYTFFGSELVVRYSGSDTTSAQIKVMDADGTYKVPSALTGYTVTGADTFVASVYPTTKRRQRWVFDEPRFYRIQFGLSTDPMIIWELYAHTPMHVHKTKIPTNIDHFMPYCFGGNDVRATTPINPLLLPGRGAEIVAQQSYDYDDISGSGWAIDTAQLPFVFYSDGGLVEVQCSFTHDVFATGTDYFDLVIDGWPVGTPVTKGINTATSGRNDSCTTSALVILPRGMHYAYMRLVTPGSTTESIYAIRWRSTAYAPQSGNPKYHALPAGNLISGV